MIQIDGLSHAQLCRALERGEMPFLRGLLDSRGYRLHRLYPGLPTTTPAVQGELFYGVKGSVPAFSFRSSSIGRVGRMYEPGLAVEVERALARAGRPLLTGGSVYCDVFTGGAAEPHICPAVLGWAALLPAVNPLAWGPWIIANGLSYLRTAGLCTVEAGAALIDGARGVMAGQDFWQEMVFVAKRVAICVFLREQITLGGKADVARGLPIVHLNYLGYDESAHRRGPTSSFAHRSLIGIDRCISRVWRAARLSDKRDYEVWIYSDHGQEEVRPYQKVTGRRIRDVVEDMFAHLSIAAPAPMIAAAGPVALIYSPRRLGTGEIGRIAEMLVNDAAVPAVLAAIGPGHIRAWTAEGVFNLPEQSDRILGPDHPYRLEAARDLVALARLPEAGDLILCGWRTGVPPMSFANENGAHGGMGPEETSAFALLPANTSVGVAQAAALRPLDLRAAALARLDQGGGDVAGMVQPDGAARGGPAAHFADSPSSGPRSGVLAPVEG